MKLFDVRMLGAILLPDSSRSGALLSAVLLISVSVACTTETGVEPTPTTTSGVGGVTSTTTSSSGAGAAGGASTGIGGQGAAAGAGPCVDSWQSEPNETESTAFELRADPIPDCDSDGDQVTGVIAGADDVDWFTYRGNDALWPVCVVNPTREISPADAGLRVCAFFQCYSPPTDIGSCPSGTAEETSPEGRPGCCGTSAFTVGGLSCHATLDDDAYVFIRVDYPGATAATCADYLLNYHY